MFIRSSGEVLPGIFMLSLGYSCHYVVVENDCVTVFEPGTGRHYDGILSRLRELGLPERVRGVYLSHLHEERASGALAILLHEKESELFYAAIDEAPGHDAVLTQFLNTELSSQPRAATSAPLQKDSIAEAVSRTHTLREGFPFTVNPRGGPYEIVPVSSSVHTPRSLLYLIRPGNLLIGDETLGCYRGKDGSTPCPDHSPFAFTALRTRLFDLNVEMIALPFGGILTGDLVRKHIDALDQHIRAVPLEVEAARREGISQEESRSQLYDYFFSGYPNDPFLQASLSRSFKAWCSHLGI